MAVERIPFIAEVTGDRQTQAMQAQTKRVLVGLTARGSAPVMTPELAFTAGEVKVIDHRLGRQPTEWSVTDVTVGYGSFRRTAWDARTVTIQSQNACTARFRVA